MKNTYFVTMNCVDGSQTVLTGGSTVELPNEAVNQQLLDIFLASGSLLLVAPITSESPEVKPRTPQTLTNKGS